MFGDMMGNMEEKQREFQEKLKQISLSSNAAEGQIVVEGNASGEITNISIDPSILQESGLEAVEDFTIVAVNRIIKLIRESEKTEAEKMMKSMIPPGLDQLKNLF